MRTSYELSDWQGYLSYPEIDIIKSTCNLLPENPDIACIGAGAGTVAFAVLEERKDVLYYSIDILATESEATTNEHLRLKETPYYESGQVVRIWGDSHIVGLRWRVPIDMLVIDGDHSLEGITVDLLLWSKHVKCGGYILCHDYGSNDWPHVKEYIDKFAESYEVEVVGVADTMIVLRKLW